MPRKLKLHGTSRDVLTRAIDLSQRGWEVLWFSIDANPRVRSTIVMAESADAPEPEHFRLVNEEDNADGPATDSQG